MVWLSQRLRSFHSGLNVSTRKIKNATKFIDYFIHDLLDYSLLKEHEKNFTKILTNFDLKSSIEEILELTRDKFEMKGLNVSLDLQKFSGGSTMVKTDQKRLQQVVLNLVTNAVKFTDRGGNI